MYSKNDYRYYLENQLTYSDDFLAHYGVKGMKWKQHKFGFNDPKINRAYMINLKKKEISLRNANEANDRGKKQTARIKSQQAIKAAQERGQTRTEQVKSSQKNTTESRKKTVRSRVNNLRKKYGLYREKPKGKKLKGGGNIYVSHD